MLQFEDTIKEVYKFHEPKTTVILDSDCYTVMSEEPKIKAVTIGKMLSGKKELVQYGGYTKREDLDYFNDVEILL